MIHSSFYTRHDQSCLLWAGLSSSIFLIAQFLPIDWLTQALFASVLTLLGIVVMAGLTWNFIDRREIGWVLYFWMGLMLLGMLVTDLSILLSWNWLLVSICPLWLGLNGIGYLATAVGIRSRAFGLLGLIHVGAIALLPLVGIWQPLFTGMVIGGGVFLVAELQWDSNNVCVQDAIHPTREQAKDDRSLDASIVVPSMPL